MDVPAFLAWFRANARVLPWRREPRDAYRVWVSEVMLQQTRVETVLRYYEPFLRAFPDLHALAAADEERVMKAWEGLGYYRRARLLHAGAREVVRTHGGRLPADPSALAKVPGFGPYTVGAVGSLVWGLALPAIDGNVLRVVSRLLAIEENIASPVAKAEVEKWVREHQPTSAPGAFNEALMELGATVCTPRSPACGACPLTRGCLARVGREPTRYPVKHAKKAPREVHVALALARRGGRVLLERRERGLLAGTWGLPWVEIAPGEDARERLAEHVARLVGARVQVESSPLREGRHVFTHRVWRMRGYEVKTRGRKGEWRVPDEVALGSAHRKMLAAD